MRLGAPRFLNDIWMRIRTSLQLAGTIAPTARRHKALLLFPVLSFLATALLFLGLIVLIGVVVFFVSAVDASATGWLVAIVLVVLLLLIYLHHVLSTFFDVALAFAAFRALREEHTSPRAALAHALGRAGAITSYSAAMIAAGLLVAPLALIPRARAFASRLLPTLGVAWSVVPLMAIPVLVRERCGGVAAIRRAVTLFRERWAETSIAAAGLKVLCLPIAAASLFLFQHSPSSPSGSGAVIWLTLSFVLGWTPILIDSFVRGTYGAALYVFAVEGVVPNAFDTAELATVWRVGAVPATGNPQGLVPTGDLRTARGSWWGPVVVAAAIIFVVLTFAGAAPDAIQPFRQLGALVSGSRPGLAVNEENFPECLQMVWSREFPEPISGLAVLPDAQVAAGGPATIFILDRAGNMIQQIATFHRGQDWASMVRGDLILTADLPGTPGASLIVSGKWNQAIGAYDSSGARRWSWQTTEPGAAVDAISTIRVPGQGEFVTVGRNGFGGLCLLDGSGVEKWCNKNIGNVEFVTTFDFDGDGRDEILSKSPHSHPFFGSKLGCYSTEGNLVGDLNAPAEPYGLRTFDPRGDGRKELLAWYKDGLRGPLVLAVWTREGQVLGELRLQTGANWTNAPIAPVKLRAGHGSDFAVALPDGWVVGTSLDGERWGHHVAGADGTGLALAALDVDGDGAQELIVASGKTVSAWAWNVRAAAARQ